MAWYLVAEILSPCALDRQLRQMREHRRDVAERGVDASTVEEPRSGVQQPHTSGFGCNTWCEKTNTLRNVIIGPSPLIDLAFRPGFLQLVSYQLELIPGQLELVPSQLKLVPSQLKLVLNRLKLVLS
jgi:hypothetical protein